MCSVLVSNGARIVAALVPGATLAEWPSACLWSRCTVRERQDYELSTLKCCNEIMVDNWEHSGMFSHVVSVLFVK